MSKKWQWHIEYVMSKKYDNDTLNKTCLNNMIMTHWIWRRHMSRMNEACLTSITHMNTSHVQNMKMMRVAYEWNVRHASFVCDVFRFRRLDMTDSYVWYMGDSLCVIRGDIFTPPIYHTYEYVMSNVWKWNRAHTNEACLACITRMNTLCLKYEHNICIYRYMYIYMLTICVCIYHIICIYIYMYIYKWYVDIYV